MLLCEKAYLNDKKQIWCRVDEMPCAHVRLCSLNGKYYQTDNAKKCKARERNEQQD